MAKGILKSLNICVNLKRKTFNELKKNKNPTKMQAF